MLKNHLPPYLLSILDSLAFFVIFQNKHHIPFIGTSLPFVLCMDLNDCLDNQVNISKIPNKARICFNDGVKGGLRLSRALLTGTAGGVIGAVTAAVGVLWSFITYAYLTEINSYLTQLSYYLSDLSWSIYFHRDPFWPLPLPYFPSASLFGVSSFILSIFLIAAGILIGAGFYGAYKIGGGDRGLAGLIFGFIGNAVSALLIIMGNLTTGYNLTASFLAAPTMGQYYLPVPTPNFPVIWIGFVTLGLTFLVLGSASKSVCEVTEKPSASSAAGSLSVTGAVVFIIGVLMGLVGPTLTPTADMPPPPLWPPLLVIGFGLIFVAFILWAVVFYSSRNL